MQQPARIDPKALKSEALIPVQHPVNVNASPTMGGSLKRQREVGGLLEYWLMIRRHKAVVVAAAILGGVAGFFTTLSEPRLYNAHATIEIQSLNDNFLDMKALSPTDESSSAGSDTDIQTQVSILQSATLIRRVMAKMGEPAASQPLPLPDRLSAWRKALGIAPPTQHELWQQALGTAAGSVRVTNTALTRIVDVSTDSTSPKLAADFVNTLADEYIEQNLEARWESTERTGEWLTNQLRDLRMKLEKSQDELTAYAASTGLKVTSEKDNVDANKLADLEKELAAAQGDRIAKQSAWEVASSSPPDSLPAILGAAPLQTTRQALQDLRKQLAQLRVTYTENHPDVKKVEAQIAALEAPLEKQRADILQSIKNEYDAAVRREKLIQAEYDEQAHVVNGQTGEMDRYGFLKREVDATRTLYDSMLQKMKEASIASALRASNIRVVDKADVPGGPYKPDVRRTTLVGLLGGLGLGMLFAIYRERADRTLQDPGDAEFYLGLTELGVIPAGEPQDLTERAQVRRLDSGAMPSTGVEMISFNEKTSLIAESFRTTLTSIMFSGALATRSRVLVVTSASPKEGKTTTVCNLSAAMAEVQSSVLLVDADMRRPRLHAVFQTENGPGLSDLLAGQEPLQWETIEPLLRNTGIPGLKLLTSGESRHKATSVLYSHRLGELMRIMRENFDTTVFDTPPMINIADARLMGRQADGVIMVVRASQTSRDAALMAKQRLGEDGSAVLGVILNGWNPHVPGYSYYKNYYAGYNHYYGPDSEEEPSGKKTA